MFTGIIEHTGKLLDIRQEKTNIHFKIESVIAPELKVDQSLAHDGVCLTVTKIDGNAYWVTAIEETLIKSSLGEWRPGKLINLERAMLANGRLDGHFVQGHVDAVGNCTHVEDRDGSFYYSFDYPLEHSSLIVPKGSIALNGVSLTVVEPQNGSFKVAIIPYTVEHTNFQQLQPGDKVNLEFDIIGKYFLKHMEVYGPK